MTKVSQVPTSSEAQTDLGAPGEAKPPPDAFDGYFNENNLFVNLELPTCFKLKQIRRAFLISSLKHFRRTFHPN